MAYYKLPLNTLREMAEEKGLTFCYHPNLGATFYYAGNEVGHFDSGEKMNEFISKWPFVDADMLGRNYDCLD